MINGIGKKWKLKSSAPEDFLAEWPEYSPLVMTLLRHRNILTQEAVDKFFNPEYSLDLYDPYLLKNMDKMVKRLQKAINDEEKVVVYGDYDADGVSGAMILEIVLREAGCKNLSVYIPDRSREGYGLNEKAVEEISKGGNQLIITVDCGITDCKETKMAQDLGMEVVITDHHLPLGDLPPTKIIVDPWQKGDKYPFKSLSGAGVAFKVAQALIKKIGNFQIGFDKWLLDLVALSTIADYMPMVDENRTLVKYGLFVLAQARRPGIKALMKVSRVEPEMDRVNLATNLDTRTIAFTLVPRINAASRMDHANTSYDLLKIEDMEQARVLAKKIDGLNRNRQKRVEEIMQEADARYSANPKEIIFAGDESWPKGLLGLIASKLSEKYYRPAFIFNIENGTSKGSARGVEEFNVVSAMTECAKVINVFNEYGGHAKAGGFSIKSEGI
ncbi:MAG: single-stranded-DNA-specific exonuclease RecJ, partial [Candidatus Portnoybacteria bacterium CG10_big_fil_rev_8_21_14_0_10_36_7]